MPDGSLPALTPELICGFSDTFLRNGFDSPLPTPLFHREMWDMCCSDEPKVAIAAPRSHGKSSAVSFTFILAAVLFGFRRHVLLVSETEGQSILFLNDLKVALKENEELMRVFGIRDKFIKDTETEVVVQSTRGAFRILCKGAEQKVRGLKWRSRRPDLIILDDVEGDEAVMNRERRKKFSDWFYNALLPCGSDNCLFRIVGTVMHQDSLLENLLNNPNWDTARFSAHNQDYSQILWQEKFSKERLLSIRKDYEHNNNLIGYMQEYLNIAINDETAMFKQEYFLPMGMSDHQAKKTFYLSADLAVSTEKYADRTAITAGGVDDGNVLHIVDVAYGRWDSLEVVKKLIAMYTLWNCELLFMEKGVIDRAIGPLLKQEMLRTGIFMNIQTMPSNTNKIERSRSILGRMKAGGVKFDKETDWYPELELEMSRFPRVKHDDIVDTLSLFGLNLQNIASNALQSDELDEEDYRQQVPQSMGQSAICGY